MKNLIDSGILFDTNLSNKNGLTRLMLTRQEITYFLQDLYNELFEDSTNGLNFQEICLFVYRKLLMGKLDVTSNYLMNINNTQKSDSSFYDDWKCEFVNNSTEVIKIDNGCTFKNGKLKDENRTVNLYMQYNIQQDSEFKNKILELFKTLDSENITHVSSIKNKLRINKIEIKLDIDDLESLEKIINIVKSDEYLNDNKAKLLEFIPTVQGIGVITSDNFDYLLELSFCIASFLRKVDNVDEIDYDLFLKYFEKFDNPQDLDNIFYCSVGKFDQVSDKKIDSTYQERKALIANDINQHIEMIENSLKNNFSPSSKENLDVEKNYDNYLEKAIANRDYRYFEFNGKELKSCSNGWAEIYQILVDDLEIKLDFSKINGGDDRSFINHMRSD